MADWLQKPSSDYVATHGRRGEGAHLKPTCVTYCLRVCRLRPGADDAPSTRKRQHRFCFVFQHHTWTEDPLKFRIEEGTAKNMDTNGIESKYGRPSFYMIIFWPICCWTVRMMSNANSLPVPMHVRCVILPFFSPSECVRNVCRSLLICGRPALCAKGVPPLHLHLRCSFTFYGQLAACWKVAIQNENFCWYKSRYWNVWKELHMFRVWL